MYFVNIISTYTVLVKQQIYVLLHLKNNNVDINNTKLSKKK